MTKIQVAIFAWGLLTCSFANAQYLMPAQETISKKKPLFIHTSEGKDIKAHLKIAKVKKGLIKWLKIETVTGEELKLASSEIAYMYASPRGFEKFANKMDFLTDIEKWGDKNMKSEYLDQGYGYFEQAPVMIKKKERILLLQVLNPSFSKQVKVYNDPLAKETAGIGVGGVGVGGNAKSYYVKKKEDPAARLIKKSKYKKEFQELWKSCDKVSTSFPKANWKEIPKHIVTFTECE